MPQDPYSQINTYVFFKKEDDFRLGTSAETLLHKQTSL